MRHVVNVTRNLWNGLGLLVLTSFFFIAVLCLYSLYKWAQRMLQNQGREMMFPLNTQRKSFISLPQRASIPTFIRMFDEFKPALYANIISLSRVFITDIGQLSSIFAKEMENVSKREAFKPWCRKNLFIDCSIKFSENPPEDKSGRGKYIDYLNISNRHASILVKNLKADEGSIVYIIPSIYFCVMNIMLEAAMGVNINPQSNGEQNLASAVTGFGQLLHKRQMLSWMLRRCVYDLTAGREYDKLLETIRDFSNKIIVQRIQDIVAGEHRDEENNRASFLDLMIMSEDTDLTVKNMEDEVNNFVFSCHDKTSAAIIWALFELGHSPQVQELAYLEQRDIYQASMRPASADDLTRMPYLDSILKETFRLHPTYPVVIHRLKTDINVHEHNIPEGTNVPIFVPYIHRNPNLYPNPERFNPDRFLRRCSNSCNEPYLPLIYGPKFSFVEENTIMIQKIVLSHILRNFKFTSQDIREDLELADQFTLNPKDHMKFLFTLRLQVLN